MIIEEFKFNWYSEFNVKLIESTKAYEWWDGEKIEHQEYAFRFKGLNVSLLKEFLIYFEKCLVVFRRELPLELQKLKFDGLVKEFDFKKYLKSPLFYKYADKGLKDLYEFAEVEKRSVIFQRRLPWELRYDDEKEYYYTVYGRFSVGKI